MRPAPGLPLHWVLFCVGPDLTECLADAIYQLLKRAAQAAGVDRGQSTHGFRRGGIQHRVHNEGEALAVVLADVGIETLAVGQRYANRSRHQATVRKR